MSRSAITRVAIIGAAGRMGRELVRALASCSDLTLTAAIASRTSADLGRDAGEVAGASQTGVTIGTDLPNALGYSDVAIDFSSAQAVGSNLAACRAARTPLLIGTTGLPAHVSDQFEAASKEIPLLVAPNTSVGVTVLLELVREAARALPAGFDIEISEAHHRMKRDAPSGTALALGRAVAEGRGQAFDQAAATVRTGGVERQKGEVGFSVVRGGDIVGDHSVLFAGVGERLVLGHQATDRAIFARGALQAAAWLAARPPGRYFMRDLVTYKSGS